MPKVKLPLKDQILKAMKVAETSEEAADYLVEQFKKIVGQAKVKNDAAGMIRRLEEYRDLVKMKLGKIGEPWDGDFAWISDFQNMQANLAKSAADVLVSQGISDEVQLDIAISEDSEWRRIYSEDGKPLEIEQISKLDILFNAWLASNNIGSKKGVLYELDIEGKIRENQQGKIKVDPDVVRALIKDEHSGFRQFLDREGVPPVAIEQYILPSKEAKPAKPVPSKSELAPQAERPKAAEPQEPQTPGVGGKR